MTNEKVIVRIQSTELKSHRELGLYASHVKLQDNVLATFLAELSLFDLFNYMKGIGDNNLGRNLLFNFYCCNLSCNVELNKDDFIFELNTYLDILGDKEIDILLDAKDKYLNAQTQNQETICDAIINTLNLSTIF